MKKRRCRVAAENGSAFSVSVVRPHTHDMDCIFLVDYMVNKAVLDVYPSGKQSLKVAYQLFAGRQGLERVISDKVQQCFYLIFKPGLFDKRSLFGCGF